jgi:HK97 family phage portal protein
LLSALLLGPTKSGASVNENTAFNVSIVRACVNFRANLLAMLPVKVYRKTASGPEEQRDHPLARLLRGRVSPAQTKFKWLHSSQVCFDLGGNAYSRVLRNSYAEPQAIRWLKPSEITPLENKTTGATAYRVHGVGDLPAEEMLHVANLSTNGFTGRSPLFDLRESVGLAMTAEEFAARSFANGNRKPGVINGAPTWNDQKAQSFADFWMKNYAGVGNAGKTPMMYGGATWAEAGFSNDEAELLGMRKFSVEEVARVYQIPLHLVGSTEKATSWGSGIEQLNQGLVDYMLGPLCANWEAEMNTTLLTEREQEDGHYIKFTVDALLRGSPASRAAFYQIMRGIAAMDVNQIREKEEWPLYPDAWAGDPRQPMNNQGPRAAADPSAAVPAGQAAGEQTQS